MSLFANDNDKLQEVLKLFLLPDYYIVTSTYLDLLLEHIVQEIKQDIQETVQILQNWIITAFNTWNKFNIPAQCVSIFTLNIVGELSRNESQFSYLNQNNIYGTACSIFGFESCSLIPSMKLCFTRLFSNLLLHLSGRKWISESKIWKVILRFTQSNPTMYVTKESQKFLSVLLMQENKNPILCKQIILAVTEPLLKVTNNSEVNNQLFIMDRKELFHQNNLLLATIETLLLIMDYVTFYDLENTIPEMFEELTSLESRVNVIFEVTISTPMMKTVHKLVKLLIFTKLRSSVKSRRSLHVVDENMLRQFFARLYYNSMMLLSKKYVLELMISKKLGVLYWKKLSKLTNFEMPKPYKFETQGIALMLLPLCVTMKPTHVKEHYLFDEFLENLFDVTSTEVQRMAYSIRDVILKNDFPMEHICKSTIYHLLEVIDVVGRDTAVIIFQTMCHALKNFVSVSRSTMEQTDQSQNLCSTNQKKKKLKHFLDGDPITDKQLLLSALLNGLNVLTKKFKLKWQECVETICLLSIAQDILNHPYIDSKICTLALKTCKLAIQNFMPPNLVLLVDFDEHTKEIGPTLFKRIHDQNWEVQDSVLEVLNTITTLSEFKYPPYQNLLLEHQFLKVAIEIANGESESYVRASALSFISTTVRINMLWEKELSQMNLCELAINLIYKESEAIVRREAVVLLKELYRYRKWPKSVISSMCLSMTFAAVLDLHWEVKVNALEFWRDFIRSHLTDQGMLDGHFPSVTFSKEDRKIVSLNDLEIIQRLNKALDELSKQYCLGVLLVTLKDESDFQVSKTSANIIDEFRKILLTYKIHEPIPQILLPKENATMDTNYVRRQVETSANRTCLTTRNFCNIIQDIVDSNDTNLLSSIYSNSMQIDCDNSEKIERPILEYVGGVSRQEFLRTILTLDIDGYIKQRSQWLKNSTNSFSSVLEDILLMRMQKDINFMDCY